MICDLDKLSFADIIILENILVAKFKLICNIDSGNSEQKYVDTQL